ncbi:hypothetical protein Hanom_Chr00s000004g01609581 [Helianthus anomalus]
MVLCIVIWLLILHISLGFRCSKTVPSKLSNRSHTFLIQAKLGWVGLNHHQTHIVLYLIRYPLAFQYNLHGWTYCLLPIDRQAGLVFITGEIDRTLSNQSKSCSFS